MQNHYSNQVENISDALQELMRDGPDNARKGLVEAIRSWYDYHYQEMQKWKLLEEMIQSAPFWTGSMETK